MGEIGIKMLICVVFIEHLLHARCFSKHTVVLMLIKYETSTEQSHPSTMSRAVGKTGHSD